MSIKLFFEISKEFFVLIYSPNLEYGDNNSETFDEEKGFQEWLHNKNA